MSNPIRFIQCRSVLTKSKLPEVDYCVNPYVGCLHGCVYCYASFMKRFTGHGDDEWGKFLDIKENAPTSLRKELHRKKINETVLLGSVTDPYQPAEKKHRITRECLKVLVEYDVPISILTKSSLVVRDLDLFVQLSNCEIGLTVEFATNQLSSTFDPFATPISERIKALEQLKVGGIRTYVFMGPIMPQLTIPEQIMSMIVGKIDFLMAESLNMRCGNKQAVLAAIKKARPELLGLYRRGVSKEYWKTVRQHIEGLCADHNVLLKGFYDH